MTTEAEIEAILLPLRQAVAEQVHFKNPSKKVQIYIKTIKMVVK